MSEASENRAVMLAVFWLSLHTLSRLLGGRMCHPHFSDEKTEAEGRVKQLAHTESWNLNLE